MAIGMSINFKFNGKDVSVEQAWGICICLAVGPIEDLAPYRQNSYFFFGLTVMTVPVT